MGLQDRQYYREDSYSNPWSHAPAASQSIVVTLIVINVAIFVIDIFSPESSSGLNWLNHSLALSADVFHKPWLLWQLLTHGFAHASISSEAFIFHVGGNLLILYMLGRPVEQQLGRSEFLRFYLIAIVVTGIGWVLLNMNREAILVDASGAVATQPESEPVERVAQVLVGASGAVTAVVALFIFRFPHQTLLLFGVVPLKAWVLGVIVVVVDLLRSLNPDTHIAWESHLAGFAFGAAYHHFKWNFHRLQLGQFGHPFKSKPSLKVHRPPTGDRLKFDADEILQKINDHGESSLTARERKILKKYSEQVRRNRD